MVVALLLAVDFVDLIVIVEARLLPDSPNPRGAEAELDKAGGDCKRL
jgi:hypothetical protein